MIVWLASYPRSGNTLLRLMLHRVWGFHTFSVYDDAADVGGRKLADAVGHLPLGKPFAEAYGSMTNSDRHHFVKTHEIPIDSQKAIYIVRDGRSASRSYCHYRRDFNGITDAASSLRDILLGFTPFMSWSAHLDAWDPLNRQKTLMLKYEQMLDGPLEQIGRIAEFLQAEPRRGWRNDFDQLAQLDPRFFRAAGANRPEEAVAGADAELFWALHGTWMRRLGYAPADAGADEGELPDESRRQLIRAIAEHWCHRIAAESRAAQLAEDLHRRDQELEAAREQIARLEGAHATVTRAHHVLLEQLQSRRARLLPAAWALSRARAIHHPSEDISEARVKSA